MAEGAYSPGFLGDAATYLPKDIKPFFFVRHGETDWNVKGLSQGSRDVPLNENGKKQARALVPTLADLPIRFVAASSLGRAMETARLGIAGSDLEITTDDRLKERDFGPHEGTVPPSVEIYRGDYEGCEATQDFSRRVAKALEHCCAEGCLLVAHGGVLRAILALLETGVEQRGFGNACAIRFDKADDDWQTTILTASGAHPGT